MNKPGLLVFYDHFYPAYKAGGPIQSLTNLAVSLQGDFEVSVVCSAYDLNESVPLAAVETNRWTKVIVPGSDQPVNIWYASNLSSADIKKLVADLPVTTTVYLNGMFSYRFVLLPLLSIKNRRIIICPRGMLQKGALAGKAFKKNVYLAMLRTFGLVKHVRWHATSNDEGHDVEREFGSNTKVFVAANIPRPPLERISSIEKLPGHLKLVYLSLISEKKNLLQLIALVAGMRENITLDIYGPVKDIAYWKKCERVLQNSNNKIHYKGDVQPSLVQEVFSQYHVSALLTKGENFGHALYECLSTGRPVITSYFTPWNDLESKRGGWNVDISDESAIRRLLERLTEMDQQQYDLFSEGAYELSNEYYKTGFDKGSYKQLFTSDN